MFDAVAKARWQAWSELGNRSKMEAMFMYTQAVEELAPDWWQWPPLQLGTGAYIPLATEERGGAATAASGAKMADAEPSVPPPLLLACLRQPACRAAAAGRGRRASMTTRRTSTTTPGKMLH